MMVSNLFPFVMQFVVFKNELLGCRDLYFNLDLNIIASVFMFLGTVLDERVRARERSPNIDFFFELGSVVSILVMDHLGETIA